MISLRGRFARAVDALGRALVASIARETPSPGQAGAPPAPVEPVPFEHALATVAHATDLQMEDTGHLGAQTIVEGSVQNVSRSVASTIDVYLRFNPAYWIVASFAAKTDPGFVGWNRGDQVRIQGTIHKLNPYWCNLIDCTVVGGPGHDAAPAPDDRAHEPGGGDGPGAG